jgi:hypothetical protein
MSDDEDSLGYNTGDDEAGNWTMIAGRRDSPFTAFRNSEQGIASDQIVAVHSGIAENANAAATDAID